MELFILDVATLGAITSVALLCAMGVAVLPWTDGELRQTLAAARAVPELLEPVLRLLGPAAVAHELRARGAGVSPARR